MLRTLRFSTVLAIAVLAVALAAGSGSATTMQWGLQAHGGFDTFAMDDWNTLIDQQNAGGSNFDNISNGFSFGAGPVLTLNEQWQFGAHYERLVAHKSSDQGTEVKPAANAIGGSVGYLFPSHTATNFGLNASVDYMTLASKLTDPTASDDIKGTGVGFQFAGTANHTFSPMISGNLTVGYRVADINVDTIGGQDAAGSGLNSENYSGLVTRFGFTYHQPTSTSK